MISNENWEFLNTVVDPNQQWFEWKTKFLRIFDKHAPILTKRVRSKHSPPNVRNACTIVTFLRSKQLNQMIHITGRILSQCETKLMLKLNLLNSRITSRQKDKCDPIKVEMKLMARMYWLQGGASSPAVTSENQVSHNLYCVLTK